jgi:nitric oxide reductase NorQ protein
MFDGMATMAEHAQPEGRSALGPEPESSGMKHPTTPGDVLPYYCPVGHELTFFEACHRQQLPLLIKGPTGVGKSRFVAFMAAKLGLPLISVACHEETSAVDLLGRYTLKDQETVWHDGPLTRAVRQGAVLYLDEIAEARPDVIVAIHSLTDHRRCLFLDRRNEEVQAHAHFMLVASYNPGYQSGWKELKPSTRQRFVGLSFRHPDPALERQILQGETGLDASLCKKLVQLAGRIRNLSELSLAETASTRLLVDAAKLAQAGIPLRDACRIAIAEPLSDDPEIVQALWDLIALMV